MLSRAHLLFAFCAPLATLATTQAFAQTESSDSSTSSSCYGESNAFICQCEKLIATKTNAVRKAAGKPALSYHSRISYVSRLWSKEQARDSQISHDWFVNGTWQRKYEAQFKEASPARAENVAYNFGFETPEECAAGFTKQWKESSGHYRNMIGAYKSIGIGVARGSDGNYYATQNFGG